VLIVSALSELTTVNSNVLYTKTVYLFSVYFRKTPVNIIKKDEDEIGGACSAHGGDEKCVHFLVRKPEGKNHSEDLGVGGTIILKWILRKQVWRL
jgi:hypothetical protein